MYMYNKQVIAAKNFIKSLKLWSFELCECQWFDMYII